jgi:hypothetical protein
MCVESLKALHRYIVTSAAHEVSIFSEGRASPPPGRVEVRHLVVVPRSAPKAEGHASACPALPLPYPGGWRKRTQLLIV